MPHIPARDADRWAARAEELRTLAEEYRTPEFAAILKRTADGYQWLAEKAAEYDRARTIHSRRPRAEARAGFDDVGAVDGGG